MLNKVMLIGNLGADPEVKYPQSGETISNIRLATSTKWKDKQTGEQKEKTEWHRVVFFNIGNFKLADIVAEYLKKGSKIYVEGRLQTRKWQDKDGKDQYTTEIVGESMQMLDGKDKADNTQQQTAPNQYQPAYQPAPPTNQCQTAPAPIYSHQPARTGRTALAPDGRATYEVVSGEWFYEQ